MSEYWTLHIHNARIKAHDVAGRYGREPEVSADLKPAKSRNVVERTKLECYTINSNARYQGIRTSSWRWPKFATGK
jgi:hypothetical protein